MKHDFFSYYDTYHPKLYAYMLARVRRREIAEDIVQQTFEQALAHIDSFRPRRGATFGSWLFAIAKNEYTNVLRKNQHVTPVADETLTQVPHHETVLDVMLNKEDMREERDQWRQILIAMHDLSDDERELLTLKYLADMSYNDIAEIMHKKPNTLAMMLKRTLEKIRVTLNVCKN